MAGTFFSGLFGSDTAKQDGNTFTGITTNSYDKSFNSLKNKIDPKYHTAIQKIIDKYDQESFEEKIPLGDVQEVETDLNGHTTTHTIAKKYLVVKGTYEYKFIAHVKQIVLQFTKEATDNVYGEH